MRYYYFEWFREKDPSKIMQSNIKAPSVHSALGCLECNHGTDILVTKIYHGRHKKITSN